MRTLDFYRYVLGGCAFAAMLADCGGSQPPIGAPGAMQQSRASSGYGYNTLYSFGKPHDAPGAETDAGYDGGKSGGGTVFSMSTSGAEEVAVQAPTPLPN